MQINQRKLIELVTVSKQDKAIKYALELSKVNDTDLYNLFVQQSARWHRLNQELTSGTANAQNSKTELAKINDALITLINKMPETWKIEVDEPDFVVDPIGQQRPMHDGQPSKTEKLTILFLAANPSDHTYLNLGKEMRQIEHSLERSKYRDAIRFTQKTAVRITDLRRALLDENPDIVHFSGHGSVEGAIYLENDHGRSQKIPIPALGGLFKLFKDQVKCVVLNACYAVEQAEEINKYIPFVIGMKDVIKDNTAIKFSEAFYDTVAAGRGIEYAYDMAKVSLSMEDLRDEDVPVLHM